MTIDQIIVQLQDFLRAAESEKLEIETAEEQLDSCYVSLNAKTLPKRGASAPNIVMDFAEARDEVELAITALKDDPSFPEQAIKHAREALAHVRYHGSAVID